MNPPLNPHIPPFMLAHLLATKRLPPVANNNVHYLAVTNKLRAHIVHQQHVLSTCDLSTTIPPDVGAQQAPPVLADIRYTYSQARRNMHCLLLIGSHFVVLNATSLADRMLLDQLQLASCTADVSTFSVLAAAEDTHFRPEDAASAADVDLASAAGQVNICLTTLAGQCHLKSLLELARMPSRSEILARAAGRISSARLAPIAGKVSEGIVWARSERSACRLQMAQLAGQLGDWQRFGVASQRGDALDEKLMLARYGDCWVRARGGRLVIGVPVFNCTFKRKRVLHNVRLVLHTPQSPATQYTYRMFTCRLDASARMTEGADPDGQQLLFEHEWHTAHHLLPETAATLVATLAIPSFAEWPQHTLRPFVVYDIEDTGTKQLHSVQLSCGQLQITADILLKSTSAPTFRADSGFRDLLQVCCVADHRASLRWQFTSSAIAKQAMAELLVQQMGFEHVQPQLDEVDANAAAGLNETCAMDVDRYIHDIVGSAPNQLEGGENEPTTGDSGHRLWDIFYCHCSGFFNGILVRRLQRRQSREVDGVVHELKIYCNSAQQLEQFVQSVRRYAGPEAIRSADESLPGDIAEAVRRSVRNEMQLLRTFAYSDQSADEHWLQRSRAELLTDLGRSRLV